MGNRLLFFLAFWVVSAECRLSRCVPVCTDRASSPCRLHTLSRLGRRASFRAGDDPVTYERKNRLLAAPNGTVVLSRELTPGEAQYALEAYTAAAETERTERTERTQRFSPGALYYIWNGPSYGVIGSSGIAATHLGFPPFFELPVDALEPALPEPNDL
jgi:hypothetical protein